MHRPAGNREDQSEVKRIRMGRGDVKNLIALSEGGNVEDGKVGNVADEEQLDKSIELCGAVRMLDKYRVSVARHR